MARILRLKSVTCHISVKLKFGVAWVQKKNPSKITISVPKFRISKEPINFG
jgi:hypothetical protein